MFRINGRISSRNCTVFTCAFVAVAILGLVNTTEFSEKSEWSSFLQQQELKRTIESSFGEVDVGAGDNLANIALTLPVQETGVEDSADPLQTILQSSRKLKTAIVSDDTDCSYATWGYRWKTRCAGMKTSDPCTLRIVDLCPSDSFDKTTVDRSKNNVVAYTSKIIPISSKARNLEEQERLQASANVLFYGEASAILPDISKPSDVRVVRRVLLWTQETDGQKGFWESSSLQADGSLTLQQALRSSLLDLNSSIQQQSLNILETNGGAAFSGFTVQFRVTSEFKVEISEVQSLRGALWMCRSTELALREEVLDMLLNETLLKKESHSSDAYITSLDTTSELFYFVPFHSNLALVSQTIADNIPETSRTYGMFLKTLHFSGGHQMYMNTLSARGWRKVHKRSLVRNLDKKGLSLLRQSSIVMSGCRAPKKLWDKKAEAIAPNEPVLISFQGGLVSLSNKENCFLSIKSYFDELQCDYRDFFPETILASKNSQCAGAIAFFKKEVLSIQNGSPSSKFFAKSHLESFGRGITILDAKAALEGLQAGCPQKPAFRPYMIQRGVADILLYQGRVTQGRHYVVVPVLDPWTVMYADGYYNVASKKLHRSDSDKNEQKSDKVRAALLTNTRENGDSHRLTQFDLEEYLVTLGFGDAELVQLRRRLKTLGMVVGQMYRKSFRRYGNIVRGMPSFAIYGIDVVIDNDLRPRLLETNCNCELFSNPKRFGEERVTLTRNVVPAMIDAAITLGLGRQHSLFGKMVNHWVETKQQRSYANEVRASQLKSLPTKSGLHPGFGDRMNLELLYTDATTPPWAYHSWENGNCAN